MADLISLAYAKQFRSVATADETAAADAIKMASAWFQGRVGRVLASATITEVGSGDGTALYLPRAWPITAVTSLTVDTLAWTVLMGTAAEAYQYAFVPAHGGWVEARSGYAFPVGSGNIRMVYTGGFATIPDDVQYATALLTHLLLRERNVLGDGTKQLGDESIQQVVRNPKDYHVIMDAVRRVRRRGCV